MQVQKGRQAEAHKTQKKKAEKDYSRAAGGKWLEDVLLPELVLEINRRLSSIGVRADDGLTKDFIEAYGKTQDLPL